MGDKNNFRENIKYDPASNNYPFDADEWISNFLDKRKTEKLKEKSNKKSEDKKPEQTKHYSDPFASEKIESALEDKGII